MELKVAEEADAQTQQKDVKVTTSVLQAFELLRSEKKDQKLSGGIKIIAQLHNSLNEKDSKYILKRLVRSLGANIPEIRSGYFATLVSYLTGVDDVSISDILELVKKELHASNSSKSEIGDVALGQILVCGAVFRSGLLLKASEDEQKALLSLLLTASKKKSYLNTVAYIVLIDFVKTLNSEQFGSIVWAHVKQELKKEIKEHSLDSLYFLLVVSKKFPEKVKLRKLIGVSEILCEDNIQDVCDKILAGIDYNTVNHAIYEEIGTQIAKSPHLQLFWTTCIDSQLVKHNRNRELATLNILTAILKNLDDNVSVIPELISKNFFKLFMDWFKGLQTASKIRNKRDDEDDHKIMIKKEKEVLNTLAKLMKSEKVNNEIRVETLKKILLNPGEMNFSEITGTGLVKVIISDLDQDSVKKLAKIFKGVLLNTSKKTIKDDVERNWYNNERLKAAELISYMVTHETVKDEIEFKLLHMQILMCFAFFKIGGDDNLAVSTDLSGRIKLCFYRCFTSKFTNVDSLVAVLSSLCNFISSSLEKEQIRRKIEKQFPKESMESWKMLIEVCEDLGLEGNENKSKVDKVFLILLYQLGLFLFSEPSHAKVARSSIKELKSCYEHYRKEKKKKTSKTKANSDEPEWLEVLVEVLLSILSVESSVLRSVVQCVFRLLWEFLTPTSIGQIVSVLDPESESNPLSQDSESEADNESDSEEKEVEGNNDEEGDSSESGEEEDEDDEIKIPDQLRVAVQKALGGAATESDTESLDADMIDEDEGKQLDEALAEAFKQFGQGKGKKTKKDRKDKKALSDFRIRVLDLIDIYLEKDPSMDICLAMIAPLMRCLEFCIQDSQFAELENRVRKTIKFLTKIRKFTSTEGITADILLDYFKSTIEKGDRSHFLYQAVGDVITSFATFIIHCSQKIVVQTPKSPKKNKQPTDTMSLLRILKEALQSFFKDRSCLLPIIFFHNILQLEWEENFELLPIIIDNAFDNGIRHFRRNEGLYLLTGFYRLLKKNKPSETAIKKLSNMETNLMDTVTKIVKGEIVFEAKNNFFDTLKKLVATMKNYHETSGIESSLNFKSLFENVETLRLDAKLKNRQQKKETKNQQPQEISKKSKKSKKKKRKLEQMNGHSVPLKKKIKNNSNDDL